MRAFIARRAGLASSQSRHVTRWVEESASSGTGTCYQPDGENVCVFCGFRPPAPHRTFFPHRPITRIYIPKGNSPSPRTRKRKKTYRYRYRRTPAPVTHPSYPPVGLRRRGIDRVRFYQEGPAFLAAIKSPMPNPGHFLGGAFPFPYTKPSKPTILADRLHTTRPPAILPAEPS